MSKMSIFFTLCVASVFSNMNKVGKIQSLAMFTLPVVVGFMLFQLCISNLALFQFIFNLDRLPVKYIPSSQRMLSSSSIFVSFFNFCVFY